MSYKTNPIANRIKINKGWKNPYLPTKALNYSRDIALWFKVYLLLKVFLKLKKIQLISCEIRFDQKHKKLLYIVLNQIGKHTKKRNRWNKKKLKSPIRKSVNKGAIYFLFNNLNTLKNVSFWNKNKVHKKILSKFWLSKPKFSNWLNTAEKIMGLRQTSLKKNVLSTDSNKFSPVQHIKLRFYTIKQKQILTALSRIKKINILLYEKIFILTQKKKPKVFNKFLEDLTKQIYKNQTTIRKINKIYKFLLNSNKKLYNKKNTSEAWSNAQVIEIKRKKLNRNWSVLKRNLRLLNRNFLVKPQLPKCLTKINYKNLNFCFSTNNSLLKDILVLNSVLSKIQDKVLLRQYYYMITNWNTKLQIKENKAWLGLNKSKRNSFNQEKTNLFLSKIFNKNLRRSSAKQKLFIKAFYKISLWLLLRIKKKKNTFPI